jgi:tetratricopeptide (TPR) repeat protein
MPRSTSANALAAQGRSHEAITHYRAVAARSPGQCDAFSNLGIALQEQDELEGALEAYSRAAGDSSRPRPTPSTTWASSSSSRAGAQDAV